MTTQSNTVDLIASYRAYATADELNLQATADAPAVATLGCLTSTIGCAAHTARFVRGAVAGTLAAYSYANACLPDREQIGRVLRHSPATVL